MWVVTMIAIAAALGAVLGLVQSVRDCFEDEEVLLRLTVNLGELKSSAPPSADCPPARLDVLAAPESEEQT